MATPQGPLVPPDKEWIDKTGRPSLAYRQYALTLDALARALAAGIIGPLTQAANDGAAAAAGVAINGLYRNGNAVQIRLT